MVGYMVWLKVPNHVDIVLQYIYGQPALKTI